MKKKITFVLAVSMLALLMTSTSIMAGARQGMAKVNMDGTAPDIQQADKAFNGSFGGRGFMLKGENSTEEALSEKLAAAVAEGRITQEMADEMIARHKEMLENPDAFKTGEGFAGKDFMFGGKDLTLEELSEKLAAAVAEGKLTQEMADEMIARHKEMLENPDAFKMGEGFAREDFMFGGKDLTLEELSEKLAALVADGRITQEMADEMIARHKEMLENPDAFKMGEGLRKSRPIRENDGAVSPKFDKGVKGTQNESV